MNVQTYADKSNPASVVHAVQIAEIIPCGVQGDESRAKLKYTDGKETVVQGHWIIANNPKVGGFFVVFERGVSAIFMEGMDFLRKFEPTPKAEE